MEHNVASQDPMHQQVGGEHVTHQDAMKKEHEHQHEGQQQLHRSGSSSSSSVSFSLLAKFILISH